MGNFSSSEFYTCHLLLWDSSISINNAELGVKKKLFVLTTSDEIYALEAFINLNYVELHLSGTNIIVLSNYNDHYTQPTIWHLGF